MRRERKEGEIRDNDRGRNEERRREEEQETRRFIEK